MTSETKIEKSIKRFAKEQVKKGTDVFQVAKKAADKFGGKFSVVNGHLYRETDQALNVVLSKDYIESRQQHVA